MPRIRTIKPDFWDSPGTARASLRARLFFIAMWNWADDYGIGDGNLRRLFGFAFPNDELPESDYPRIVAEVSSNFGVVFFEHSGRPFYVIPSWEKHQRTEKRATARDDLLEAARRAILACDSGEVGTSAESVGESAESLGRSGAGTGELGNWGTGEVESNARSRFAEFWDVYPRRDDKRRAEMAFAKAVRRADVEVILGGARRYAADPNRDPQFTKQPATWLNADSWENGPLPARGQPQSKDDRFLATLEIGRQMQEQAQRKELV